MSLVFHSAFLAAVHLGWYSDSLSFSILFPSILFFILASTSSLNLYQSIILLESRNIQWIKRLYNSRTKLWLFSTTFQKLILLTCHIFHKVRLLIIPVFHSPFFKWSSCTKTRSTSEAEFWVLFVQQWFYNKSPNSLSSPVIPNMDVFLSYE